MHVHILGICGTFMGGIAAIAKAAGHHVTGSDRNVYPPMSTQLEALGIGLVEGYGVEQLEPRPDMVVVGNVMTRGAPVIEALLDGDIPFVSGPEWLSRHVLADRWVLAVSGTHGKTTTTSLLAWILDYAGLSPGFLIGGVPANFDTTARLGAAPFFVIEADEYDTAFFDKRAKFVHYRPRTLILNNLEFDHADIYPDLASIQRQFHHLVRIVPPSGLIVHNAADAALDATLAMGCWSPREGFAAGAGHAGAGAPVWTLREEQGGDGSQFEVLERGESAATVKWTMQGAHNALNALAAIAAARHAGVPVTVASRALGEFRGIRRRMELRGVADGVSVYDDFAHHPTAIATTIDGLRRKAGRARIVAVLEPRSNTMKMGVHSRTLAPSLAGADEVWIFAPPDLGWDVESAMRPLGAKLRIGRDIEGLADSLAAAVQPGDQLLIMSNGGFGGLHGKVLAALRARDGGGS